MKEPRQPGPKKLDTRLYKGAAVDALAQLGETPGQIAENVGISISLVDDILNKRGRWASLETDHALQEYRTKIARQHELMARELSTKLLKRIEATVSTSSLSQAVIAFGILQEKIRLLAGESTQNIAFGGTIKIESEKLTDMLARLISSLKDDVDGPEIAQPAPILPEKEPLDGLGLANADQQSFEVVDE